MYDMLRGLRRNFRRGVMSSMFCQECVLHEMHSDSERLDHFNACANSSSPRHTRSTFNASCTVANTKLHDAITQKPYDISSGKTVRSFQSQAWCVTFVRHPVSREPSVTHPSNQLYHHCDIPFFDVKYSLHGINVQGRWNDSLMVSFGTQ